VLCRAMSGFYEVTAASGTAAAGDESASWHDSANTLVSHPAAGRTITAASDAAGRLLRSPYGLTTKTTGLPHSESPAGQPNLHSTLLDPRAMLPVSSETSIWRALACTLACARAAESAAPLRGCRPARLGRCTANGPSRREARSWPSVEVRASGRFLCCLPRGRRRSGSPAGRSRPRRRTARRGCPLRGRRRSACRARS
jgi:hypothetical protein